MKGLWRVLIILVLAIVAGLWLTELNGYIRVETNGVAITTSLRLSILLLAGSLLLLWLALQGLRYFLGIPARVRAYFKHRLETEQLQQLEEALLSLALYDWQVVENSFQKLATLGFLPAVSRLLSGYAQLHQQRMTAAHETFSRLADDSRLAWRAQLVIVDHWLSVRNFVTAKAALSGVLQWHPKEPLVAERMVRICVLTGAWQEALPYLVTVQRSELFSASHIDNLSVAVYEGCLNAATHLSLADLERTFKEIPRNWHYHLPVVWAYTDGLLAHRQTDIAESFLRKFLNYHWNDALFARYCAQVDVSDFKHLELAEGWFNHHPKTYWTWIGMARLCVRQELLPRAKQYYHNSLRLHPSQTAYEGLAEIYLMEKQFSEAVCVLKQALELRSNTHSTVNVHKALQK